MKKMNKYKIIAIIGKSGAGKDSLLQECLKLDPSLNEIISCTSRPRREHEVEGKDYYYMTREDFESAADDGKFLEIASFNGWYYGIYRDTVYQNKINIGVFNPTGIYNLLDNEDIDLTVYYITTNGKTRLLRQLMREENPDVDEIIRRYQVDEKDFKNLDFKYVELSNEENYDLTQIAKSLLDHYKFLGK